LYPELSADTEVKKPASSGGETLSTVPSTPSKNSPQGSIQEKAKAVSSVPKRYTLPLLRRVLKTKQDDDDVHAMVASDSIAYLSSVYSSLIGRSIKDIISISPMNKTRPMLP